MNGYADYGNENGSEAMSKVLVDTDILISGPFSTRAIERTNIRYGG